MTMHVYQANDEKCLGFTGEEAHALWQHLKRQAHNITPAPAIEVDSQPVGEKIGTSPSEMP
jgi:hypothetical protein